VNRRILAIEDDQDALANLRDILELDGYRVTGAGTLTEAAEQHTWSDYFLILLDRKLPDGSADTVLPLIQSQAPGTAIIVTTGYADLDGTIVALRSGAADYLFKPINPDLLRAAISRVVRLHEMEVRVRQSERLAGIGQMIAVLTHESRNVLARSQAMIELLSEEVQGPPEAVELIDRLYKCQLELHRLYDEVRNYAAPIKLDRDIQGVGAIWRQTWSNLVANRDAAKEASLIEQTSGVDLTCEVDHFRLDQVFRNLFENSLSACPSPAQVEIACADAEIYGQPALRVIVRDNGPGLTPEQAQNVFHPFYTTKQNGTGLGMAIAKRIIDAHNGSIAVGGKSESGAEFIITLPRKGLGEG
jgi:signal transduction histidine kinase